MLFTEQKQRLEGTHQFHPPRLCDPTVSDDRPDLGQIPVDSLFFSPIKSQYRTITSTAIR